MKPVLETMGLEKIRPDRSDVPIKFSIALSDLENLLKTLAPRPKTTDTFTLSACAARVRLFHSRLIAKTA